MYPESEPRIIRGYGGTAIPVQRIKVALAKYRSRPMKKLRCMSGFHNPPVDEAFEELGVVCVGGECTECNDTALFPVTTLMDVFHRPNRFLTSNGNNHTLQTDLLNEAVSDHMELIGCDDEPRQWIFVVKLIIQLMLVGLLIMQLRPTPL